MRDHSCYIAIQNNLDVDMTLVGFGTKHGYFATLPVDIIAAGTISPLFHVKDSWGGYGSEGWVQYRIELANVLNVAQRPIVHTSFGNTSADKANWYSTSCLNGTGYSLLRFSNTGHDPTSPLFIVTGTISYNSEITTETAVLSVRIQKPVLNVYNTKLPPVLHTVDDQLLWEATEPNEFCDDSRGIAGSYYPATVDLTKPSYINVVMNVDKNLVGVPFRLQGNLGVDVALVKSSSTCYFITAGPQTIAAIIQPSWSSKTFPWGIAGDVEWSLFVVPTGKTIRTTKTRLEIYGLAKALPKFFGNSIDVAFLRTIVLPARWSGETDWIAYCIKKTFTSYGILRFRYDTRFGVSHFGPFEMGGNFNLRSWLLQTTVCNARVNCYDQAGIFQICLGLSPHAQSTWKFLAPFGFLRQTNLIGVGPCNNPFYEMNGSTAIVGDNDPERTSFGAHVFVAVASTSNHIADSCAGPHVVSETIRGYIDSAVQKAGTGPDQTTLYRGWFRPGTAEDVVDGQGITSINNGVTSIEELNAIPPSDMVQAVMNTAALGRHPEQGFVNANLPAVHDFIAQRSGLRIIVHDHEISAAGSEMYWLLESEQYPTEIRFVVLSSVTHAHAYFQGHLSKYSRNLEDIFTAGPHMRMGQLCLTSSPDVVGHGVILWTRGNVFAYITGPMGVEAIHNNYAKHLDLFIQDGAMKLQVGLKPVLRDLQAFVQEVKVGEEFTVYSRVEQCSKATVRSKNGMVLPVSQDPLIHSFRLRAFCAGADTLSFAFAHVQSGMVVSREVEVIVLD